MVILDEIVESKEHTKIDKEQEEYDKRRRSYMEESVNRIIQDDLYFYIHIKNTEVRNEKGMIMLSNLTSFLEVEKVNLLEFIDVLYGDKIDISKICNSLNDNGVNLYKYTENTVNGLINLAGIVDSMSGKIDITRFFEEETINLEYLTDSTNNDKINFDKITIDKCTDNNKMLLSKFTDSRYGGKINLYTFDYCISNGKIDVSKIKNSRNDEKIDLYKYTINVKNEMIYISKIYDSTKDKLDLQIFDGIFDKDGKLDIAKIFDGQHGKISNFDKLKTDKFMDKNKLLLSAFTDSRFGGKIDLFNLSYCISNGKIDISKIKNSSTDENIDFFKYTCNFKNGVIDLNLLINNESELLDVYKINGLLDKNKRFDLSQATDSSLEGKVDILKTNFDCHNSDSKIFYLESFTDAKNNGKFNLFNLQNVITRGKIDLAKINNSANDSKADILKYTIHQSNGKILIDLFRYRYQDFINLEKFNGIERVDQLTQSQNVGEFKTGPNGSILYYYTY